MLLQNLLLDIGNLEEYKIHFAKYNGYIEPLNVYLRNFEDWKSWNTFSNGKHEFNRKYIFSLINFHPENDTWLFGGIWEVVEVDWAALAKAKDHSGGNPYKIELSDKYKELIGRLKIYFPHNERGVRNRMENYFPRFELKEILPEPYSERSFPGYKNVHIDFDTMSRIVKLSHPSWKAALQIKGIYLLTDRVSGKRYVGQAGGQGGIWQRWCDYISDGHGGDINLKKLVNEQGFSYIRKNFTFTLLEIVDSNLENNLTTRENYWKSVLLTRNKEFGYNEN